MMNYQENVEMLTLSGTIVSDAFNFNNEVQGEKFYNVELSVKRVSGTCDVLVVVLSERLIPDVLFEADSIFGIRLSIAGSIRTYNDRVSQAPKNILKVFAFASRADFGAEANPVDENMVNFKGVICKQPVYRKTPLNREVADLLLAVNRAYGGSSYIPCITWGRNSRYAGKLAVGQKISAHGRFQSRGYQKMHQDGTMEERTVYEVSINLLNKVEEE